ncbi:MAG TPA: cytochrome c oxidase subunit II [Tepidisphaeraceae bacterium]|jgi:cytochrome c oxidase subunit 2
MNETFRLFPRSASTFAPKVDAVYFFQIAVAAFFTLLILTLVIYFSLRYSRKRNPHPEPVKTSYKTEIGFIVALLSLTMVMCAWGTRIYVEQYTVPAGAMEIHVIGKQWMWKTQHPEGQREINSLHIPAGRPIRLVMASQDVIHSFYIPAFRIKRDVVPGRYNEMWFQATSPGQYHLFCAEYCGSHHSAMIGSITVMEPGAYQQWLAGTPADEPPIRAGEKLFTQFACNTCHGQRAPTLAGLYGRKVTLTTGETLTANDSYIRESILNPSAHIVAGYPPIMPTYQGQISEEQLLNLMAYIKTLKDASTQPTQ